MYRHGFSIVLIVVFVLVLMGICSKVGNVQNALAYDQDWDGAGSSVNWH